jgi:hypothetical protein
MAAGLARRVVALVASLLLGSCSSLVAGHYTTHASFEEAYRAARVVAIVPPGVQVWEHQEGGNILHVTWSVAVSQLISRALEAEFEARGLAVVRVEERPETEPYISSVRQVLPDHILEGPSGGSRPENGLRHSGHVPMRGSSTC